MIHYGFVRLPVDYRSWGVDGEEILTRIDNAVIACCKRGLHLSLSLQEALVPADPGAQDIFVAVWERIALRYRYVPPTVLSFGLVDEIGQAPAPVIRRTVAAVLAVAPDRPLTNPQE
ncbi:hypothetical protein [Actinoplanes sp. NPDC026619]|uniref:hypothetical protein n=1 Tax=Actinoplanes sp. NPDC026619 TaxID=3155798 RepID=UPI0033D9EB3A